MIDPILASVERELRLMRLHVDSVDTARLVEREIRSEAARRQRANAAIVAAYQAQHGGTVRTKRRRRGA